MNMYAVSILQEILFERSAFYCGHAVDYIGRIRDIIHTLDYIGRMLTAQRCHIPIIHNQRRNMYAVSILPQAMAWEVGVPTAMLCGSRRWQQGRGGTRVASARGASDGEREKSRMGDPSLAHEGNLDPHPFPHPWGLDWMTHIFEANLWLTSGRTRSQLHYDKENIMLCLYRGVKRFVMIDTRKYFDKLSWARGGRYNSENDLKNLGTDWVTVDVDAVDLRVHKKLRDIEYDEFILRGGDCVFMPYSYLHFVDTNFEGEGNKEEGGEPDFQIATSFMFLPETVYDVDACEKGLMPLLERVESGHEVSLVAGLDDSRNRSMSAADHSGAEVKTSPGVGDESCASGTDGGSGEGEKCVGVGSGTTANIAVVSIASDGTAVEDASSVSTEAAASINAGNRGEVSVPFGPRPRSSFLPAATFDILWYYSGKGVIPQGYPDPVEYLKGVREVFDYEAGRKRKTKAGDGRSASDGKKKEKAPALSARALRAFLQGGQSKLAQKPKRIAAYAKEFTRFARRRHRGSVDAEKSAKRGLNDEETDAAVAVSRTESSPAKDRAKGCELHYQSWKTNPSSGADSVAASEEAASFELGWPRVPLELWLRFCVEGDHDGGLPCDEGHSYVPRSHAEWGRMRSFLEDRFNHTLCDA